MIYTNALSLFLLEYDQNGVFNRNLCSIQYLVRLYDPAVSKFKRVCADLPNLALLTKSVTPGGDQVTYTHASVGNDPLGEAMTNFALAGLLEALTVTTIDTEHSFAGAKDKIHLPTTKVLLHSAVGGLYKSEKLRN